MKFVERKTDYPEKYLKIFGFKIFWWKYAKADDTYYRTILNGVISTVFKKYYAACSSSKTIKICGVPVLKIIDDGEARSIFLFDKFLIKKLKISDIIKKEQKEFFSGRYDGVIVLSCNSGEAYLFLRHIFCAFIKKYNLKNPVIVCTKKYHSYLVNAYCPNIPYAVKFFPKYSFKYNMYDIEGVKLCMIMHPLYFVNIDKSIIAGKDIHYFDAILEDLNISKDDIINNEPIISKEDELHAVNKVSAAGLNSENFVFISPESLSCRNKDSAFWCNVIKYYQNKGFDIFVNVVQKQLDLSEVEFKSCFLTFPEALEIARKSKKIIGSRSGLLEYLLQANVDIDVIYAPFHDIADEIKLTAKQIESAYSMKKLPFVKSKVSEYNKDEYSKIINQ